MASEAGRLPGSLLGNPDIPGASREAGAGERKRAGGGFGGGVPPQRGGFGGRSPPNFFCTGTLSRTVFLKEVTLIKIINSSILHHDYTRNGHFEETFLSLSMTELSSSFFSRIQVSLLTKKTVRVLTLGVVLPGTRCSKTQKEYRLKTNYQR